MKKSVFCCLASLLCWSAVAVRAAKVDTVEVHSRKMGRAVRTIVISPEKTEGRERLWFICCTVMAEMKPHGPA